MHNIVFVVDVSRSMLVPDFASGSSFLSRLDASKEMIRQTLRAYDATSLVQFSLIAFSTKYRLVAPPTTSRDTIARMLSSLHPRVTGAAGTDLAVIGDIISTDNDFPESTLFIIFTDGGEDMSPTIRQGFLGNVLVVPIGSDSGGLVPQDNSLFPIPSMSPDS
jgi:Mg-chelatase subunit ChlD